GTWLLETGSSIMNGLKTGITTAWQGVLTFFSTVGTTIRNLFVGAGTWLLNAGRNVITGLANGARAAIGFVRNAMSAVKNAITSFFGSAISWLMNAGRNLISGLANGVRGAIGRIKAVLGSVKSSILGAFAGAGRWLFSIGQNIVQGLMNGIGSLAGQIGSWFLNKIPGWIRGPFKAALGIHSPSRVFAGYGRNIGEGLILGVRSMRGAVRKSSKGLAGTASDGARSALTGGFSGLHGEIEKAYRLEVLEPNARKVAEWRAKEAKANKKLEEQINNIRKSKSKAATKDKNIAKARARRAKESKESYKQLAESMEKTNFDQIPRSFEKYWIEGTKKVLTRSLSDNIRRSGIVKQVRGAALGAVREGRRVFGKHPIFSTVEKSVNAKHFESVIVKAVEDAGIAEIPVDLVISNLDQFKKDLGMGNGVVSRALDQAMKFDPAQTDSRAAREAKTEVHYHVRDMQEAIRLEKLRERKQLMKVK
ncbi:hypothetical protein, partial [uncultured Corynebacterium sp.]|uniref:phage tail protein n=1 Tax=uncultured Corynebacterium sp. TaxID=159447 RepID=UPI00345C8601